MIDTNQLLSIAFTLISNFTDTVRIPPDRVPRHQEDLQRIAVGNPHSPLDLWLVHKRGDVFRIRDGIVFQYESPDSYFNRGDFTSRSRLIGGPTISSNQVFELATNILGKLARTGDPLRNLAPQVVTTHYKDIPFYVFRWPVEKGLYHPAAEIEIDAREPRVASVALWAPGYYDYALARNISNRVYTPDPPKARAPPPDSGSADARWKPSTNVVLKLIPKWLSFCSRLGLEPGSQTNLAEVDWVPTFKAYPPPSMPQGWLYAIQFKNGTCFECDNETVFGHVCGDASFIGAWAEKQPEYWKSFAGTASKRWQDLAAELNARLVSRLGIPKAYLDRFTPSLYTSGTGGMTRCCVDWYETKSLGKMPQDSIRTAITTEFDLATGQIKNLTFHDWNLLKWQEEPTAKSNAH